MKSKFRLFKRGKYYYSEDAVTGKQESLHTSDSTEARRLLAAKNETVNNSRLTLAIGQTYLAVTDPQMLTRTWAEVMAFVVRRGGKSTQERCQRALNSKSFEPLRKKPILETTSSDFLSVLSDERQSTSHYLKLIHSAAMDLGWLTGRPILSRKCWPKLVPKAKRAISWEEHRRIVETESSQERALYYETLWETGASQNDAAQFSADNVDWTTKVLVYSRAKTGQQAIISIGQRLESILKQLPSDGLFFPKLFQQSSSDRAAEFYRRCKILKIRGVSLHSFRYAWAERAFKAGFPERYAQVALGHGSRAIHHAYARRAKVTCPALQDYESKIIPLNRASANEKEAEQRQTA